MLLGLVLVAPPTAGASTPAWRATSYLATSPLAARQASCPDAGLCVVVGGTADRVGAYAVSRDGGASWTLTGAQYSSHGLSGISCPTAQWCMVAGVSNREGPLLLLLLPAGPYWSSLPLPRNAVTTERVSCAAEGTCVVAGSDRRGPALWATTTQGATWTRTRVSSQLSRVGAIWCGTTFCLVAGRDLAHRPAVLRSVDAGGSWVSAPVPGSAGGVVSVACGGGLRCMAAVRDGVLDSIDGGQHWCPSQDRCVVAGRDAVVVTATPGDPWSELSTTSAIGSPRSLSCTEVAGCTVVGETMLHGAAEPGATWTSVGPDRPPARLGAMACPTTLVCLASGGDRHRGVVLRSVDHGRTWAVVDVPPGVDDVPGVACGSALVCLAVTDSPGGFGARRSTDGGATWAQAAAPTGLTSFEALTCVSERDCWAVGATGGRPRIGRTDDGGATWRVTDLAGPDGVATGVSCAGSLPCVAVGTSIDDLAMLWRSTDGDQWSPVAIADTPGLAAVSCTTTSRCAAVGQVVMSSDDAGATWASQPLASPSDQLFDVACDPTLGCAAVGWSIPGLEPVPLALSQALVGDVWTIGQAPQGSGYLIALTRAAGGDCVGLTALDGGIGVVRYG